MLFRAAAIFALAMIPLVANAADYPARKKATGLRATSAFIPARFFPRSAFTIGRSGNRKEFRLSFCMAPAVLE